jgi:hypothetical protein
MHVILKRLTINVAQVLSSLTTRPADITSYSILDAYCTCVFGLIKMRFRRLIVLMSDDVVVVPQGKKANLTEFS